ncbi:MAG: hypothetical protein RI907_1659 [Pseudomonadota bacterium]|jgi:hypothetical protein
MKAAFTLYRPARLGGLLLSLLAPLCAHAISVQTQATDLPDLALGQDLWRVDYTVKGALAAGDVLNLLFDAQTFGQIKVLGSSAGSQLDALLIQPDAQLQADGELLLTALSGTTANDLGSWRVQVVSLTGQAPAAQRYEWLDADFNVRSTGLTSAVPEPSAAWLALIGAAITLPWWRRQARQGD